MMASPKVFPRRMEQTVSRKSGKSASFVLPLNFISVLLTFTLSSQTVVTEGPLSHSSIKPTFQPEPETTSPSPSCTLPTRTNGMFTSCSGYTAIPTESVPMQKEILGLDMSNGNTLEILTSGQLEEANLPKLLRLILRHCQIHTIHRGAFRGGQSLAQLFLENNQIEFLDPQVFDGLTNLQGLFLDNNPIKSFQEGIVFPPLLSLTRLSLTSCKLSSIPDYTFGTLVNLKSLNLNDNELTTLSWKVFRNLKALKYISFRNNSIQCDCHASFLLDILDEMSLEVKKGCGMSSKNKTQLSCSPEVEEFRFRNEVRIGDDLYFECSFSGYPPPTVKWLKDRKLLQNVTNKYSERNMTNEIVNRFDSDELKRNVRFKQVLIVHNVTSSDSGNYACLTGNEGGQSEKLLSFIFKLIELSDNDLSTQCGTSLWIWILVMSLGTVILIFLVVIVILILRIRRNERQDVSLGLEELYCIREAISEQEASPINFEYSSNVKNPLLD